jgi:ribosomal-protein-serine acetyltransferase
VNTENGGAIDALIERFYGEFDNRTGRAPSAAALRSLFAADARITRVSSAEIERWTVDEFIAPRIALLTRGPLTRFHEWEVRSNTTVFDAIAHRESHYRKTGMMNGAPYDGAGRKFIQLYRRDASWLISSVLWEDD